MWFDNLLQLKVFDFLRCRREMFTHLPFSCMSASIYSQYVCALHISDFFKMAPAVNPEVTENMPFGGFIIDQFHHIL